MAIKRRNAKRVRSAGKVWGPVIIAKMVSTRLTKVSLLATIVLSATSAKKQPFSLRVAGLALTLMKLTLKNAQFARKEPFSHLKARPNAWLALPAIRAIMRKVALRLAHKEPFLPTRMDILGAKLARSALV